MIEEIGSPGHAKGHGGKVLLGRLEARREREGGPLLERDGPFF